MTELLTEKFKGQVIESIDLIPYHTDRTVPFQILLKTSDGKTMIITASMVTWHDYGEPSFGGYPV